MNGGELGASVAVRLPLFFGLLSRPVMRFSCCAATPRASVAQRPSDWHVPASDAVECWCKSQPVDDFIHGRSADDKKSAIQPCRLQVSP